MNRRRLVVAALVSVAGLAVASPAFAHIDPDPTEAQAGSEVSVGFTVEHGCEGSPTVQLDMRLPDGATNPVPEPPEAWTGSVDGNVVTFEGGSLPDDQELTFRVRMVLPPTSDTTIYFPFVQRCEVGEIRWIDIPTDDTGAELGEPAPAMLLFGPVATTVPAPTTAPAPTTTASSAALSTAPTTTGAPTTVPTSTAPTTAPPSTVPAATDPVSATTLDASDGGGSTGTVAFVLSLVGVAVIAAIVIVQARRRRP